LEFTGKTICKAMVIAEKDDNTVDVEIVFLSSRVDSYVNLYILCDEGFVRRGNIRTNDISSHRYVGILNIPKRVLNLNPLVKIENSNVKAKIKTK